MSDKLVVDIDSKDAEVAMRNLDRLTAAAEQMGKAFENTKGATSALRELRLMLTGIKGQQSSLDQLTDSIKNMNSSSESLKRSIVGSIKSLGTIIKSEMEQVRAVMFTSGISTGKALAEGIDDSTSVATGAVKRQGRTLAAAAKAEATRVYESMVSGQANAKIKDVGALFKLEEAGATLSPYHKQVLANWKKSSTETFRALKAQLATEAAQIEAAAKSENAALQARLQEMEAYSKSRSNSLTNIYRRSLARGASNISQVKAELKAERTALEATVRAEEAALQEALGRMESASRLRSASLSDLYAGSLKRGSQSIARVRAKLKEEALEVLNTVKTEEAALQAALGAMEQNSKVRKSSLTDIYAASLLRGNQSIARVKAQLKEQANQIIQAQETEMARVQRQVSAATNNASGMYQRYNPNNGMAGSIIEPGKTGEITQMSKALKQLTIDGNDAHSMARGLASGFNLLWLTWGNLVPLFAGASISFGLKKTFDIGSEVEYQIKMMETLGQTTQSQGKVIREALREIDQTTQFSLVELSQAMVRLGQSGKTPKEALEILRPAADLASVGMVDLKTSTDLLIQTQALFGKSTADVGKIAAQVFEITKSGVLNVEDIGASMKYASEANTRFGKSVEETLTILGALAQAGIKGASGGTAYINFLRDLNGRSGPAIAALKELEKATGKTIQVFKETGEQRSAVEIFTDIAAAADKLKAKDADKLLAKIFSDRGGRAFFAMVRDGTIDLEKTVKTLEEVKPENLFLAAKGLMDTTKGALNVLQGALVGTLDKVFEANETKFKTFITDITAVISSPEFGAAVHSMVSAVGSLYESIKTLMPVLQTLGTAWVVFKAASIGVSVFQGLAAAIAGMAPVLGMTGTAIMRNTAALATSTQAWSANGVAMIGNVAASRAAAAGIDSVGVAAARSAATAAVAGTGMRALAVVLGFLSNPIVGIITTLGLLGAAFWSAKSDAEAATSGISNAVITNGSINIKQWKEEIKVLRDRNALMGQTDAYTPMEGAINEARAKLAKESSDYMQILEKYERESKGATARQQEVLDARYGRVLENKLRSIRKEQDIINQAQDAIDAARLRDLSAKEESERQQRARQVKPQGDTEIPGGGGRGNFVEQIRVANDNELKEIEKRNNAELTLMQNASANAQKVLDARHQAGLISEGEYQARAFAQVRQSEADQLAMLNDSKEAYTKAMTARATTLGDALQKAMKLGDSTQIDKFSQELQNLGQTAETFYTGVDNAIVKIADNGMARLELASIKAQAAIKKIADTEREYWKKDSDETSKIRALQATEEKYRSINESVFSLDLANKAAALAGAEQAEKLNSHLAEMDYSYQMAESAALSFMTSNIAALQSGDTEATKLYNNLREVADALNAARESAGIKAEASIRDRGLLAFEKARKEQNAKLASDLSDAVMTGLTEGGKAGKKKLRDMLVAEIRRPIKMVVDLTMNAAVNGLMNLLGFGGRGAGGAGGAGGIMGGIQTASNLSTLWGAGSQALYGATAGASAASLGYANLVGMAGGDAIGALAAANGMWTGVATGAQAAAQSAIEANLAMEAGTAAALPAGTLATAAGEGTAAGGGLMSSLGAAAPWIAGAVALAAIVSSLDDSGTYHTGGAAQYSAATGLRTSLGFRDNEENLPSYNPKDNIDNQFGTGFGYVERGDQTIETVSNLARGLGMALDGVAVAFGEKAGYAVATAFADDTSEDGAWGALRISKDGQELLNWENNRQSRWAPREFGDGEGGYKEYLAAVAKDTRQVLLDMDLPSWADKMLTSIGESANMEQLTGVLTQIGVVQSTFVSLGNNMSIFANLTDEMQSALLTAAGSIDALTAGAGAFYQGFYTEAEKTEASIRGIVRTLTAAGLEVPTTQEQFRKLVDAQVALGEGGAQAVTALFGVSAAFAEVTNLLNQQVEAFQEAYYSTAERNRGTAGKAAAALQAGGLNVSAQDILSATRGSVRDFVDAIGREFGTASAQYRLAVQQANTISGLYEPISDKADSASQSLDDLANSIAKLLSSASSARDLAGSAMDKLAGAAGFQDDGYARIREARLWEQMATAPWEQQIELASELTDIVVSRYETEKQAAKEQLEFAKSLRDYVDSLMTGDLSPLTNAEKLSKAQDTYLKTLAAARGGDTDAQGKLQGASSEYLELARNYYASSETYTAIFESVTGALGSLGKAVEVANSDKIGSETLAQMYKLYGVLDSGYQTANAEALKQTSLLVEQLTQLSKVSGGVAKVIEIIAGLPVGTSSQVGNSVLGNIAQEYAGLMGQVGVSTSVADTVTAINSGSTADLKASYEWSKGIMQTDSQRAALEAIWSAVSQYRSIDGSHADGLAYVPFDGYTAELHKGERVLTAYENRSYSATSQDYDAVVEELQGLREDYARLTAILAEVISNSAAASAEKIVRGTGAAVEKATYDNAVKAKATVR